MKNEELFNEFMIYDQFIATSVNCPWCGQVHELDVVEGDNDARYQCNNCSNFLSVNWVTRTVRQVSD